MGDAAGEQAGSMVVSPPSSSGVVGSRVGGGPGGGGQTQPGLLVAPLLASLNNDLLLPQLLVTRDTAVPRGQLLLLGYGMCISVTLQSLNVHQGQWGWPGPRTLRSERQWSKNKR